MLAAGDGDLWMMSTPDGRRGFFYETWAVPREMARVDQGVRSGHGLPADVGVVSGCERGIMTAEEFAQEYMEEFHGDGTEYFDRQFIEEAIDLRIPELNLRGRN